MADEAAREQHLDRVVVTRLTVAERVQHVVLMVSVTILMLTGLPLLLPEIGTHIVGGVFSVRTFLHRFAGSVLIGLTGFHVVYVLVSEDGRRNFRHMLPRLHDVRDFAHHVRYQLGKADAPARFDKFNPFEKFEYFAVVWGSVVMIITGLMMWFFEVTLRVFPKWVYDFALLIHGYEALLAFLAIILVHLYNVHLKPGVFPMSRVWLDGKMTAGELQERYPLAYERWVREQHMRPSEDESGSGESAVRAAQQSEMT